MDITEIRIKLMQEAGDRLQAFCSVTFDNSFVVRDLKIIEGAHGSFVAMPSRKLARRCIHCGSKNHLRAVYCNQCGQRQSEDRVLKDAQGRTKLYADIAHPINSRCREMIQERIIKAFHEEQERAKLPGYVSSYDDFEFEDDYLPEEEEHRHHARARERTTVQPPEPMPRGPHRAEVVSRPRAEGGAPPRGEASAAPRNEANPVTRAQTMEDAPHGKEGPHTPPCADPAESNPSKRGDFGAGIL